MQKAQDDVKQTVQQVQDYAKQFAADAQAEAKEIKPIEAGVAMGVALLLSLGLHLATKQKEDSVLTLGVVIYAIFAGILALILRKKEQREQFITMVVTFSFLRLVFEVAPLSVILLSASPALVNIASEEVKKHVKVQ
jgi:hypothetical protein